MRRLPDDLQALLESSNVPWRIEQGKRHYKIFVGERMVGILPRGSSLRRTYRAHLNTLAQVRRAIRQMEMHP